MKKIVLLVSFFCLITIKGETFVHLETLDTLIKQLKLKTSRAEFIDTPQLLESIIEELHVILNELQSLSCFTHNALGNLAHIGQNFNIISEKISNLIPEKQIVLTIRSKDKEIKKNTSISHTLKVLEKYHLSLTKNIRSIDSINKILHATIDELENIQQEIYDLAHTIKDLALAYRHEAHELFTVALKLFTLTGIESDTGPYLDELEIGATNMIPLNQ